MLFPVHYHFLLSGKVIALDFTRLLGTYDRANKRYSSKEEPLFSEVLLKAGILLNKTIQ